jgi:hypothetical protein
VRATVSILRLGLLGIAFCTHLKRIEGQMDSAWLAVVEELGLYAAGLSLTDERPRTSMSSSSSGVRSGNASKRSPGA